VASLEGFPSSVAVIVAIALGSVMNDFLLTTLATLYHTLLARAC